MIETLTPLDGAGEITALLESRGLITVPAAVAHLSFSTVHSYIGARDAEGRVSPLFEFLPLPMRGDELLEEIAAVDEHAPRLVANYRRAVPELAERLAAFGAEFDSVESPALAWLFSACSLALGFGDSELAGALAPGVRSVQVDTMVVEEADRYLFDGRRLLRSLMSYRIAGVGNDVLARSIFEGLGDFVAGALRRLVDEWSPQAVVCAGDLVAGNRPLRNRLRVGLRRLDTPVLLATTADT